MPLQDGSCLHRKVSEPPVLANWQRSAIQSSHTDFRPPLTLQLTSREPEQFVDLSNVANRSLKDAKVAHGDMVRIPPFWLQIDDLWLADS